MNALLLRSVITLWGGHHKGVFLGICRSIFSKCAAWPHHKIDFLLIDTSLVYLQLSAFTLKCVTVIYLLLQFILNLAYKFIISTVIKLVCRDLFLVMIATFLLNFTAKLEPTGQALKLVLNTLTTTTVQEYKLLIVLKSLISFFWIIVCYNDAIFCVIFIWFFIRHYHVKIKYIMRTFRIKGVSDS